MIVGGEDVNLCLRPFLYPYPREGARNFAKLRILLMLRIFRKIPIHRK